MSVKRWWDRGIPLRCLFGCFIGWNGANFIRYMAGKKSLEVFSTEFSEVFGFVVILLICVRFFYWIDSK